MLGCEMSSICRYNKAVRRIDYPADIFDINVTCKISGEYSKKPYEGGPYDGEATEH